MFPAHPNPLTGSARRMLGTLKNVPGGLRRKFYGPITHVETEENLVALTFDDGPHPDHTPALLDILDSFHAKATFFMVGEAALRHPEIMKQVAEKGHAIGNHSFTHQDFTRLTGEDRKEELQNCDRALSPFMARLFRPPYGAENARTHHDALALNYRVVKWSISVDDWREHPADWIAERLFQQMRPGSIALLHDSVIDRPQSDQTRTLAAVRAVLRMAAGRFGFCTLPQLLAAGRPKTSFNIV